MSEMKVYTGISGAWNYTIGPVLVYEGPRSIDEINLRAMPVVVVAEYIQLEDLAKIDMHHVYGFVLQGGGAGDPARVFYSNQHRATVMQCSGILAAVRGGETIVIDGVEGKAILHPDEETAARYEDLRKKGPPPEPEGFTEQLIKDAMEMRSLDPESMQALVDVRKVGAAVEVFMKMWDVEALKPQDVKTLEDMVKGSKFEDRVKDNLKKFQDAVKAMPPGELAERKARALPPS